MKPVLVSSIAQREIDRAASHYEARREGLGAQFGERVAELLEKIAIAPEGFQMVYRDLRRAQLRQFMDYALWFRVLPDSSIVVACLSGRMNPVLAKERAVGTIPIRPPER